MADLLSSIAKATVHACARCSGRKKIERVIQTGGQSPFRGRGATGIASSHHTVPIWSVKSFLLPP
jgi:hypothetical protein